MEFALRLNSIGHAFTAYHKFYCPQLRCSKVMFLHLSVILFTGECIPACIWADTSQADTSLGRHPLGRHPLSRHPLGRYPPGQTSPLSRHPSSQTPPLVPQQTATAADGTHPTGMHSCCS